MELDELRIKIDEIDKRLVEDVRERMKSRILSPWYLNVFPSVIPSAQAAFRAVLPMSITRFATALIFQTGTKVQILL